MPRHVLDETRIHAAVRDKIAKLNRDIVEEVQAAIAKHAIVIVGMRQNPQPKNARKVLDLKGIPYHYLEYGSYFSQWRRRTALKMWTGWPTFPMVFVKGNFVGGAADLARLEHGGELAQMLA